MGDTQEGHAWEGRGTRMDVSPCWHGPFYLLHLVLDSRLLFCTSTYLPVNCSECAPASHLWKQLLFLGTLKLLCTLWHCRASPCYRSHSCTEGLPE